MYIYIYAYIYMCVCVCPLRVLLCAARQATAPHPPSAQRARSLTVAHSLVSTCKFMTEHNLVCIIMLPALALSVEGREREKA